MDENEIELESFLNQILFYRHSKDSNIMITKEIFKASQDKAKDLLRGVAYVDPELEYHWESIAVGQVPDGYIIKN